MTATSSTRTPLRIPYGVADFIKLRRGNEYYVDKTHYLPLLESAGRFLFLIRPRRFGKSLLQSMMITGVSPITMDDVTSGFNIDYGKLRHLIRIDRRLNGNFGLLCGIIETGEQVGEIKTSFPVEGLLLQDNFVSLLYYFGLLTFAGEREGRALLRIPNRTVWQLMYGYLREAYEEVGVFRTSAWEIADKLNHMAYRGEWQPFFDYLAEQIGEQASVRDYLQGEKMVQGFLLAWLNLSPYFTVHSEQEQGGGFTDLYLAPFYFRYPDMRHAYLIELKYLNRNEDTPAKRQRLIEGAEAQLHRYRSDPRVKQHLGPATLHPIVLLYSGWELVYRAELGPMSEGEGNSQ